MKLMLNTHLEVHVSKEKSKFLVEKKKTLFVLNIVKKLPINRFLDLHKYSNTTVCRRSEVQENICKTECTSPLKHCKEQNTFVAKKQNFMNTWRGHVNVLVKYLRYLLFVWYFHFSCKKLSRNINFCIIKSEPYLTGCQVSFWKLRWIDWAMANSIRSMYRTTSGMYRSWRCLWNIPLHKWAVWGGMRKML